MVARALSSPGPRGIVDSHEPTSIVASITDLHVTFERRGQFVKALRGVSLDVRRGEILGVVGESGSGKSVLGLAILGLLPRDPAPQVQGALVVEGTDMLRAPDNTRRATRRQSLGAIFQDPMTSLNPTMRIGRQVAEASHGSREQTIELLRAVGFPEPERRLGAYPHELSGGLRQRVMIAMAVADSPALVLADEPTTALDVTVQAQILDRLRELRDDFGCSFMLITHDLAVAAQVADRIAVLYGGRLAEVGLTSDVLGHPSHPYTAALLESRLTLEADRDRRLTTLAGEPPDPRRPPPGCPFAPRCSFTTTRCEREPPVLVHRRGSASACVRIDELDGLYGQAGARTSPIETSSLPRWQSQSSSNPKRVASLKVVEKTFPHRSGQFKKGRIHALRGVTFDLARGEALAIVGESGSGKSTLLRLIAGLSNPDHGSIEVADDHRPQMVFQDAGASLTPWLTVGELLSEQLVGRGLKRRARADLVEEALARVGLPRDTAHERPKRLSGGQRQRVALARATIVPPPILLCDEPTSSLDVSLAGVVLNLVADLRRQLGMAVIFVTHNLAVARLIGERIAVMYLGSIVELGSTSQVIGSPQHPYTKALLAAMPGPGRTPAVLRGEPASPIDPPTGCAYHPRCPEAAASCADTPPPVWEHDGRVVACIHEVTVGGR